MIREVKLIDYLPEFLREYREIQGIMNAENPELQSIEDVSENVKDNMFVSYKNNAGIERYERMFGLTPNQSDTLHDRQMTVLTQYTNSTIYTMRGLIERLDVICGVNNYTVQLIPDEYKMNINLNLRIKNVRNTINTMLIDMLPANILLACDILYNTHELLSQYPTYILGQFTHQELREEIIEDNVSATCDNLANYTMDGLKSISCENISRFGMRKV